MKKFSLIFFFSLVLVALLTPFWVFRDLMFPYVTSKAFFFRIVVEAALPFYLYLLLAEPKLRPNLKEPINLGILAFFVFNLASALAGVNVTRSLWGNFERMGGVFYTAHLVMLFFYVQMLGQAGGKYLKRFLQAFIAVAVAVTINGLSGWLGGPTVVVDPSLPGRVSSTFGNPIFFPSYLIVPMFLSLYFALQEENKFPKTVYSLAAALQLLGIYSSGTRGAVIGLFAGIFAAALAYAAMVPGRKAKTWSWGLIGIFSAAVLALFILGGQLPTGSTLARLTNLRDNNTEARLIQWRMAVKGFADRPILGVGPENYYAVSNQYYDPSIYKHDASWFDKPHNFLLEILVTTGVLGFVSYLVLLVGSLAALWHSYRSGLLSLLESCVLLAAVVTYQVQNLTVFDTVSASVAFFAFLGFTAYLRSESRSPILSEKNPKGYGGSFATVSLLIAALVVVYVNYVANLNSMMAAKRVNYGMAYTEANPQTSAAYFQAALEVPFNLDPGETANRFSDFANKLAVSQNGARPDFVLAQLNKATDYQRQIAEKVGNDPVLWMRLAMNEMLLALLQNRSLESARTTIDKAVSLSPNRAELQLLNIQYYSSIKDWPASVTYAKKIAELNPYNPQYQWQLAMAYYLNGETENAVRTGDAAVQAGYQFTQLQQFSWYTQYYQEKGDWPKVASLLEKATALQPEDSGILAELARAYARSGDVGRALALARQVAQSDPAQKPAMEELIASLSKE